MSLTKLMLVGGFLGSGKTTALASLAKHFSAQGFRVGLITNDQAEDLVDTERLRSEGYRVGQVAGACFCCSFHDLIDQAANLEPESDIIIAEPVGSCTDLAATVSAPILKHQADTLRLMPYSVMLDPILAEDLIVRQDNCGFAAEVGYIIRKQLAEADIICINKVDQLNRVFASQLVLEVQKAFPDSYVFPISAFTGEGFRSWLECWQTIPARIRVTEVDYDIYAKGEQMLGWLNLSANLESQIPRGLNSYVMSLVRDLATRLSKAQARIAHIKVMVSNGESFAVAHQAATNPYAMLSASSSESMTAGTLLVNARVAIDPQVLEEEVLASIASSFEGTVLSNLKYKSFRPGRPVPVYRLSGI